MGDSLVPNLQAHLVLSPQEVVDPLLSSTQILELRNIRGEGLESEGRAELARVWRSGQDLSIPSIDGPLSPSAPARFVCLKLCFHQGDGNWRLLLSAAGLCKSLLEPGAPLVGVSTQES